MNSFSSQVKEHFLPAIKFVLPNTSLRNIRLIKEGWDNYVMLVENRIIFRFPRFPEDSGKLQYEPELLKIISHHLPLRVPDSRFENLSVDNRSFRFSYYPFIPGRPLKFGSLRYTDQDLLAAQISGFLKALHQFDLNKLADLEIARSDNKKLRRNYSDLLKDFEINIFPLLGKECVSVLYAAFSDFFSLLDKFDEPVLIHGDIGQGNVIYERSSSSITGIIDWEDSIIGDPAFDLAGVLEYFHDDFFHRVISSYGHQFDSGFLGRVRFYKRIAGYYAFAYGKKTDNSEMMAAGLKSLSSSNTR